MQPDSIVIVNPTKFLGNLLIALGVIQESCQQFEKSGQDYFLVFDESFKPILKDLFPQDKVIYYPRKAIKNAGSFRQISLYLNFVKQLRKLKATIALDMEGDSVSRTLTRLSGANRKIGPDGCPKSTWYDELSSPKQEASEFYKYRNVLACVSDVKNPEPHYGQLAITHVSPELKTLLKEKGLRSLDRLIILHAGASKARKLWPTLNWITLAQALQDKGYEPVLIGAGDVDVQTNQDINRGLATPIPDLANALCLVSLSEFMTAAKFYIGNDSGPMHLATAFKVPGIALFGPTKDKLWGPLLDSTSVMRGYQCPESCRNGHDCELSLRCLTDLSAEAVFNQFRAQVSVLSSSSKSSQNK